MTTATETVRWNDTPDGVDPEAAYGSAMRDVMQALREYAVAVGADPRDPRVYCAIRDYEFAQAELAGVAFAAIDAARTA